MQAELWVDGCRVVGIQRLFTEPQLAAEIEAVGKGMMATQRRLAGEEDWPLPVAQAGAMIPPPGEGCEACQ